MATKQMKTLCPIFADDADTIRFEHLVTEFGTSSDELVLTEGTPTISIYTTCASTSASTSAEPFYLKSTMTGAAGVGGRARFHCYTNVALGGWANALKAYMEFGASGRITGLASALCAELVLSAGCTQGTYTALEGELVLGSGAAVGTNTSFIYLNASGAGVATFDTSGLLLEIGTGITPASGKFASANSITLKCKIEANTRYMYFSHAEDCISVGLSGTEIDLGTSTTARNIESYATSSSTNASTSIRPIYSEMTMTGAGGVGGRAEFKLTINAALGGWSNAIKGNVVYGASGKTTGLGSVICGDLTLSAGTSDGTYAVFEGNIIAGSGASTGTATVFFQLNADGALEDTLDGSVYLFGFGDALDAASGKFIDTDITTHTAYAGIRINIDGVGTKYLAVVSD